MTTPDRRIGHDESMHGNGVAHGGGAVSAAAGAHAASPGHAARVVAAMPAGGHQVHAGLILVILLVIGGLGFGAVRLTQRRRAGRNFPAGNTGGEATADRRATAGAAPSAPGRPPTTAPEPGAPEPAATEQLAPAAVRSSTPSPAADTPAGPLDGPPGHWAVQTSGLMKRFGANVAIDDVELNVPRGSAFGYLGPNGAGKTTLIRTLLGLTRSDGGTMSLLGLPVPAERSMALARVGAIVDEPRFYGHLTGRDNLRLLAAARGAGAAERIGPAMERVGLADRADDRVASYSMGMRQRLGVAACLLGDPELLILDEPMNGLDPAGMHEMRSLIEDLVSEGRTVMLSSHLLDEVERTCDTVAIVDHGRVIRQGPIDELVRGAGAGAVEVECSQPAAAARLIEEAGITAGVTMTEAGVTVTLPAGASRELVAELNRRLVSNGISVYGLREARASLEDWFLSVTSRLGDQS